ncbi:MAG: tRNA (adenosine(37)-N6)-threonylcarbamoyltransferase complex dimerization subunit type 1 TsaB [Chitinophagaceae bacterium]|nr:tRNA (adenosine(37)-N6)-threonylcarbamoyltransferase complex dimerization subunit type 1 TsaB [Chitinophagaceae bacterium]
MNPLFHSHKPLNADMTLLLCIDTSTTHASVALAKDGVLVGIKVNQNQREHASFLQPAVQELLQESGYKLHELSAIAVTSGPGSYTGLRVGFASAKGFCYALDIPLISIPTTLAMSAAATTQINKNEPALLCPMIDARRMEVFTALYQPDLSIISPISALILTPDSYASELNNSRILFFGDGAKKWQTICRHSNALFPEVSWNAANMVELAHQFYQKKQYSLLAYSVPEYGKGFHSTRI